ncbi:MAG TPA: hypothetical protein VFG86_10630 [Chloroflexota bacterium]|nr:hypothetical protein [Chloroflexota bacterium]
MSATATSARRRPSIDLRLAARTMPTDVLAAGGLLAATLLFYFPLVFLGRALADYDALVYFIPQRAYLARSLLSGQLPLWDPDIFLGAPFLANPQTAVLYPPSWLFLVGPPHAVYTLQLVLHAFLAALFTYLFARRAFGVSVLAGAIGGLSYAFGGFAVGQVGHLNQISAAAWLPAVLLAYQRFTATRHTRWIALGALALGLQILAGHPQETYMTLIVLGILGVVCAPWTQPKQLLVLAIGGVGLCLLGAAVSAAQVLPTLELAPLSIRGEGVNWKDAVAGSLPSYLAVRALFPPFWVRVPYTEYLGYAGVAPVTLGLLAIIVGRARGVIFGTVVCALGIFLALGENNGMYRWVFDNVPGFATFRVPARWLLAWEFGAAVMAALGADWVARGAQVWIRRPSVLARVMLLALILMVGLAWQLQEGEDFVQRRTPLVWAALAAATLAIGALPHLGRPVLVMGLLVGLVGGELWAAADASPARQAPPPVVTAGEAAQWLVGQGVGNTERLLSLARPEYVPTRESAIVAATGDVPESVAYSAIVAQKWHDTLTPNVALQYGLSTADGYDGGVLPLLRWVKLSGLVVPAPRPDGVLLSRLDTVPQDRVLELLGVRYLVTNAGTVPAPGMALAADFGDLRILQRAQASPRDSVVFSASVAGDDAALARMREPDWLSSREVVLSEGEPLDGAGAAIAVTPQERMPTNMRAHVSLPQAGYLLQREAWYAGWRARVDGQETPVVRADVLYRAVPLPAGDHDVEVYFESSTFQRGAIVTVAGLILVVGLLALPIIRTRVRR